MAKFDTSFNFGANATKKKRKSPKSKKGKKSGGKKGGSFGS